MFSNQYCQWQKNTVDTWKTTELYIVGIKFMVLELCLMGWLILYD